MKAWFRFLKQNNNLNHNNPKNILTLKNPKNGTKSKKLRILGLEKLPYNREIEI